MRTRTGLKDNAGVEAVPDKVLKTRGPRNKPLEHVEANKSQINTIPAKTRSGRPIKTNKKYADKENQPSVKAMPEEALDKPRRGRKKKVEEVEPSPKIQKGLSLKNKIDPVKGRGISKIRTDDQTTSKAEEVDSPIKRRGRPPKKAMEPVKSNRTTNIEMKSVESETITSNTLPLEEEISIVPENFNPSESTADDPPAPVKRRGRPPKKAVEPVKKTPSKNLPTPPVVKLVAPEQNTLDEINIKSSSVKGSKPTTETSADIPNPHKLPMADPPTSVKRRGRPPKKDNNRTTHKGEMAGQTPIVLNEKIVSKTTKVYDNPRASVAQNPIPVQEVPKESFQTTKVPESTPEVNVSVHESPRKSLPSHSSLRKSPVKSIAIEKSTPAISNKPAQVPLQRSPIYLTDVQKDKPTIAATQQNKRPMIDEEFGLKPLKPQAKRTKQDPKNSVAVTTEVEDVYGFEFNESQEPPKPKKKVTKPRQPRQKKIEGPKFWDDKNFMQRQKQIKVNIINKDFKPLEKPIPPPPVKKLKPVNPPALNSTVKSINPPSEINIIDIPAGPLMESRVPDLSMGRSMPWRYSSIKPPSMVNLTMSSLNDSNGENVNPISAKNSPKSGLCRPLHTLQPQRSPMKVLNHNETILVPRPRPSPMKRVFGVENNFGFESDDEDFDDENLDIKRRKIDENIDSLKKFRHSLNLANSSSPLGPVRMPRPKVLPKAAPSKQLMRNIFTSTPQQMKIQDAFKASTPLATPGSSKEKNRTPPKLFESLTFHEPPKRNYSQIATRRKKRVDFLGCSDDDVSEDEGNALDLTFDDEEVLSPRRKQHKKPRVNKVQEEKLAKFVDEFNSMCEEVEQYELVIE